MTEKIKVGADREVKFDKELRLKRQVDYDINNYDIVPYWFENQGAMNVYKNFNFSIFVDDYCNADCKFCVAQLRYENRKLMYKKARIEDDDEYFRRLEELLKIIRPLNPSVSITGGEPSVCRRLPTILKLVDKFGFRKRTITSNGSHLFDVVDGAPIIQHLIDCNWDHLNISRTSTCDSLNREIMRYHDETYCSNDMLKEIISVIDGSKLKHRISCLLLRDSVNSVEKIRDDVKFYVDKCGANNFIFRELMDYDTTAVNEEKKAYCVANKVKLNDIWAEFEKFPEFEPYMNILGYYYYVEIYKLFGATVASESANLNQQTLEVAAHPDMVYETVFHPNGNLCASWIDHDRILDKYKG